MYVCMYVVEHELEVGESAIDATAIEADAVEVSSSAHTTTAGLSKMQDRIKELKAKLHKTRREKKTLLKQK